MFFLCGLWHGASWSFVVWGLFHGAFLVVERLGLAAAVKRLWPPLRHAYLLLVVAIGWVFFRADTLRGAAAFLRAMFGFGMAAPTEFSVSWYLTPALWLTLAAGALGSAPLVPWFARWLHRTPAASRAWSLDAAAIAALSLILVASILQIAARSYSPFIYFRF